MPSEPAAARTNSPPTNAIATRAARAAILTGARGGSSQGEAQDAEHDAQDGERGDEQRQLRR